jgi:hypothetical protein
MEGGLPESSALFKNPIPATRAMIDGVERSSPAVPGSSSLSRIPVQFAICFDTANIFTCQNIGWEGSVLSHHERGPGLKSNQRLR